MPGPDPTAIAKAKQAGYSDTEILDHLAQTTPQIATARKAGYGDDEIVAHLSAAPPAPPKDTSAWRGIGLGALKALDNAATAVDQTWPGHWLSEFGANHLGMPTTAQTVAADDAARANNTRTGFQTVGNMAGTALATLATRGKGGVLGQGALSGALLTDRKDLPGIAMDALTGAVSSKATGMAVNGLSYLAKPVVSPIAQKLADAGIPLTIGQIAASGKGLVSKIISKGEEALTSTPYIGDMINVARSRGTEGFNIALGNRVLANIGQKLPAGTEPGSAMVDAVGNQLSQRYGALVPKLHGQFDAGFAADLVKAKDSIKTLPNAKQSQFMAIMKDVFGNRVEATNVPGASGAGTNLVVPGKSLALPGQAAGSASGAGTKTFTISGQELKDAESKLTFLVKQYRNSSDPDQRIMADAIDKMRGGLRSMVTRNNPAFASELQALNKGWAQFQQLRSAANSAGNATGVVTPAQALTAARKAGIDDKFVKAAKQLLPNTTPDSGTARRGATALAVLAGGGGAGAALLSPSTGVPLAAGGAASLLYTKAGQDALNKLVFAPRGPAAARTAMTLKELAKAAPVVAPALLAARQQGR